VVTGQEQLAPGAPARLRTRPGWVVVAAVLACVGLVIGIAVLITRLRGGGSDRHGAPAAVLVDGRSVPYAGLVPWVNPIASSDDPRVIYVYADNDRIRAAVCLVTADRATVRHQSAGTVSVLVAGYASSPTGDACDGVGHEPVPVPARLTQPWTGQQVIDATDGTSHVVLDPRTVPSVHQVPSACDAEPLRWDEHTGIVTRTYRRDPKFQCLIVMQYGPAAAMQNVELPIGTISGSVRISGASAQVWRFNNVNNHEVTLQWSPDPSHEIRLTVNANPAHPLTNPEVLAIARSIN